MTRLFRNSKYNARKVEIDGYKFDSQAEARRYDELKTLVRAKAIKDLEIHPAFPVIINGKKICKYIADFRYTDTKTRCRIVEDVKSPATRKIAAYRLKKKLVEAWCNIHVEEVLQ